MSHAVRGMAIAEDFHVVSWFVGHINHDKRPTLPRWDFKKTNVDRRASTGARTPTLARSPFFGACRPHNALQLLPTE